MSERHLNFSDIELDTISKESIMIANLGEDGVSAADNLRIKLLVTVAISKKDILTIETATEEIKLTKSEAKHKADILEETIRRARIILQIGHKDSVSLRDDFYIMQGWGSVFDPESRIRKLLDKHSITDY